MATPWQPQGNRQPFESAIVARIVPATSGVFGLHTRRQQLFIGEAANLREELLLHRKEATRLFSGRQPGYFSYEICEPSLCASRAQALIAEHHPSIQASQLLASATLPQNNLKLRVMEQDESKEDPTAPSPQWPESSTTVRPNAAPRPSYFARSQLAILGLSFVITAAASGFFGFITGKKIAESRLIAWQLARASRPQLAYMTVEASKAEPGSDDTVAVAGAVDDKRLPETAAALPPLQMVRAADHDGKAAVANVKRNLDDNAVQVARPDASETKPAPIPGPKKDLSENSWSVQISATQDQTAAQLLRDKLKSKGIDAFIVEAEINSTHWYRVRVGRYSTSQEAEKIRQDLQSKEKLASAFVTGK